MSEYRPPKDSALQFTPGKTIDYTRVETKPGYVPVWSFSTLMNFEQCPYRVFLKSVRKIKEDTSDNEALNRGNKIHDQAEQFVDGTLPDMPASLGKFKNDFTLLQEAYNQSRVQLERNWGITEKWEPCDWKSQDLWGRIKLDAFERTGDSYARVIDYKTGRKFGNELKHGLQGIVYTVAAFERYPELERIKSEFWYLDKGEKLEHNYTRAQSDILKQRIHSRAIKMTTATSFPPKPSKTNCKWCPYAKSGDCEYAEA